MGDGPISYLAVLEYAIVYDLDEEQKDDLIYLIRQMDIKYFEVMKKKREQQNNGG
jgi:hypothetical protein